MRKGLSDSIIERILGQKQKYTLEELEKKYPQRTEKGFITRFAPSPTGFMHLGGLYQCLLNYKLALQTNGSFILRIEDTDSKREITDAVNLIYQSLKRFNICYNDNETYGPYIQSKRQDIYISVVAELLKKGLAYPCFLSADEIENIKKEQTSYNAPTGIYGVYAKYRDITENEINVLLNKGLIPAIRLYSKGDVTKKILCKDEVRGVLCLPENNMDEILLKSNDRLPTYHFAHVCDDHYMRTTHVIRSEEWISSFALHVQLFKMMGWDVPKYIHTSTIDKIDEVTGKQRKLSKRKDPESNLLYFIERGFPTESILEYLFNIICSKYEEDKLKNKVNNIWNMDINIKKIPTSPALFNMQKLNWWSKEFLATLSAEDLTDRICNYVKEFRSDWNNKIDRDYLLKIFSIERSGQNKVRKDFITYEQTLDEISYFFDDLYTINADFKYNKSILEKYLDVFDVNDDKSLWWQKIVNLAQMLNVKNGEVAMNLRVALTSRTNTPDLYSIIQVLGKNIVIKRIKGIINDR